MSENSNITKNDGNSSAVEIIKDKDKANWLPTVFGGDEWGQLVNNFFGDFDRYFGKSQVVPCDVLHVRNADGDVVSTEIQYALAGYDKDNINIKIDGDKLSLVVEQTEKEEDSNSTYLHRGISHRRIETSYSLNGYDKDNIGASFEDGILNITLPVRQKGEAKQIEVKSSR